MASIADVYVDVLPDLTKFNEKLKRELLKVKDVKIQVVGKVDARQVKDEFAKVKGAKVNVDAKADHRQVKEEFAKVKGVKVHTDAKADSAQVKEEFARLKNVKVAVEPKLDKGAAALALAGLGAVTRGKNVKVKVKADVDVDKKSAKASVAKKIAEKGFLDSISVPFRAKIPLPVAIELAGQIPAAVPLIGSMVQAVGQLSGALGLIPAAAGAAGLAVGSLKIATLGFGDALKAIGDPEKFAEAVAQLSPAAQQAATAIQGLMPQITQLRMTVQDSFFKEFAGQIKGLGDTLLPTFTDIMSRMSSSAGTALSGIGKQLQTSEMQADIKTFGRNASQAFSVLLQAAQPLVKAFTDIATVGSSFLPQLAGVVSDLATKFGAFIGEARESGKLAEWIQGGIEAFTKLKDIAVNVWTIFKGVFQAAGGGDFLNTVVELTNKWTTWVNSVAGQNSLKAFFDDAKRSIDQMWPIIRDLAISLFHAFMGAKDTIDQILPLLGAITRFLARHEELAYAIGVMFASWKLASILGDLAKISTALLGLQGTAATAGAGIRAGLLAGIGSSIPLMFSASVIGSTLALAALALVGGIKTLDKGMNIAIPTDTGTTPIVPGTGPADVPTLTGDKSVRDRSPQQVREPRTTLQPPPGSTVFGPGGLYPGINPPPPQAPSPHPGVTPSVPVTPVSPNAIPDVADQPAPAISNYGPPPVTSGGGGGSGGAGGADKGPQVTPGAGYQGFGEPDWDAIADAESGGNWQANTGNGFFGGLQIMPQTWTSHGGPPGTTANMFSKEDQIAVAENILQDQGPGAWPTTFRWKQNGSGGRGSGSGVNGASYPGSGNMPVPRQAYGLPLGSNSGGYGGSGVKFPDWVNQITQDFGVKPSTYPKHQEGSGLNKGIDWKGTPAQMRQLAEWAMQHPEQFEQLIYWDPETGRKYGLAGGQAVGPGTSQPGYYASNWAEHGGPGNAAGAHVHTRQSMSWGPQYEGGMSQYSYDGPGYDRNNPMYVQNAKETGGEQLGQDFLAGIGEVFGLGDLFKDPTQFGLFKIFKAFMGLSINDQGGRGGQGGQQGYGQGQFTGGGGGGGLMGMLQSLIPQPFGNLNVGSPGGAPGQFMPLMPEPGGGGVVLPGNVMASPFSPTGPESAAGPGNNPVNIDQRTIFNGPVGNIPAQQDAWNGAHGARFRQGIKSVPVRPA